MASVLREMVDLARREAGGTLADLTVLAKKHDPVRFDTGAGHRDARWFRDHALKFYPGATKFHLRALHYRLINGVRKPNGEAYENTEECWKWLGIASKAARWLGYLPFDKFTDARNEAPDVVEHKPPGKPMIWCQTDVLVPELAELDIDVSVSGFEARQPWQVVIFGEKSSLKEPLMDFHDSYGADLYVGAGETSDTLIYHMAAKAAADGRPLAVLCIADFDPSGHQMPISIAWKLELLRLKEFPELRFHVVRVGLTLAQVKRHRLPSTPLKETEKRADRWESEHGRAQTEIDALLALRPHALDQIVTEAVLQYFDPTLDRRVQIPEAELDEPDDSTILASSDWSFAEFARKLKQEKAYGEDEP
jgi:hypothetical protein